MKKLKIYIMLLMSLLILPGLVRAASGSISVSGTSQVVVGNKVTLTVTLKGSDIGSWNMQLSYDSKYLQLTSSSAEAGGTKMAASATSGIKSKSYTFTFKTLKKGSTTVSVNSYEAYAFSDMSEISLTSSGKTIKIITQDELEASYSKDNNLKSLKVDGYEITPAFSKDNLNYSVDVPEGTNSVIVSAEANDKKANVSGIGEITVSEGANNIKILVRAENGSEKTYNLVVNVIDRNPINVNVDNTDFTVVKLRSNYTCPATFVESEITINEITIPACFNENINYTLVGLKNSEGEVINYIYNNNTYNKYLEVTGTSLKIVILDYKDDLKDFIKSKAIINDNEYEVFKVSENSKTYIVYGINVETGKKDFYTYDSINKTFGTYDSENLDALQELNQTYKYVIIAFGVSLVLSILCIIILIRSKSKLIKKFKNMDKEDLKKLQKNMEEQKKEEQNKNEEKVNKKKKKSKKEDNDKSEEAN